MNYWLFKSEPHEFSLEDLQKEPGKTAMWDGIRNYQARNLLRDQVKKGDQVFFYHSNAKPSGIVGIAEVVRTAYPDPTQFDRKSKYHDARSSKENPRWICVDIRFKKALKRLVSLNELKEAGNKRGSALKNMVLLKNSRLSIQPIEEKEWKAILKML
jgi:predicted RNA-binding protein with PUA-like domain